MPQVEAAGRDLAARGEHGGVGAEDEIVAEDDVERGVGVERRANRAECAGQVLFVGVEPAEDVATRGDGVVEAAAERVVHAGIGGSPVVAAERGGDVLARYRGGRAFADEVGAGDFGALRLDGGRARLESGARVENRRDNSEFQGFAIGMLSGPGPSPIPRLGVHDPVHGLIVARGRFAFKKMTSRSGLLKAGWKRYNAPWTRDFPSGPAPSHSEYRHV